MKKKYLLDSNICIYFLRGRKGIDSMIQKVGWENCYISQITLAELLYGAECSKNIERNKKEVYSFCHDIKMLSIDNVIEEYARQKAILRRNGTPIDDMDIFIGCTAVVNDCVMVTENVKHLNKLENIIIENWVDKI